MLPTHARMRHPHEFTQAVRGGVRAAGPALSVHVRAATPGSGRRVGFIVGKTVGTAVVRNRVRRQLRHLVRERLNGLAPDLALVVRAHPGAAGLASATLGRELDQALTRATDRAVAGP